jgi:hypothetical protein
MQVDIEKKVNRLFRFGVGAVIGGLIVGVAFWGAVIYVAVHFISKYW